MDLAAFKTELNLRLGDTDNFTFTDDEKTSQLQEAINDESVVREIWDDSLTFSSGTFQYDLPADVSVINDIYIKPDNSEDEPEKIASHLWEVVEDRVHFKPGASIIPSGNTLYLKGKTKLNEDDTVTEVNLQEYILNLAQLNCLKMLGMKRALRFLKNDTSMAEVIALRRELQAEVARYKARLPRAFENA